MLLGLLAVVVCPSLASAQTTSDDEPFLPGIIATFRDDQDHTATRIEHQLAYRCGEAAADPRLAAGVFRGTWQGHLYITAGGAYRFFLVGSGEAGLRVAGRDVVPRQVLHGWDAAGAVTLGDDYVPFELSFRRTGGDARLMLLWAGPDFGPEPVPPRLLFHPRERTVRDDFERGALLGRVLRCGRCHGDESVPPAPALDRLAGNVSRRWLTEWLAGTSHGKAGQSPRRMPAFDLSADQAEAIADWLLVRPTADAAVAPIRRGATAVSAVGRARPSARAGERLFVTLGCLACHAWRDLGAGGWLGGGDLTAIGAKRPAGFFAAWLADPGRLNRDHRMPVFTLAEEERTSLALFLAAQTAGSGAREDRHVENVPPQRVEAGRKLVQALQCGVCHRLPGEGIRKEERLPTLGATSAWEQSCVGAPDAAKGRPGYRLDTYDARAVRRYYADRLPAAADRATRPDGRLVLVEHNCLACHAREGTREAVPLLPPLLPDKLAAAARRYPDLATIVPALTPPVLTSVGDKLTDQALADAVARRGEPHRPYLQVRMPRYRLSDAELHALTEWLVVADRIPEGGPAARPPADRSRQDLYTLAGGRLVSSDGFGCTSCHAVGHARPAQAPVGARGPDLSQLGRRVRHPWFERWVRNPARIVPRMEMPAVQLPVAGVLGGKLDQQLAALWHVLNVPGFEPPPPNPVRTLRQHGHDPAAAPVLVTDLLRHEGHTWLKPFLVGLANRHNVLLDLEAGNLALWTVGDAAWQRTEGKAWWWHVAGTPVLNTDIAGPDLALVADGREIRPTPLGQFVTEADAWQAEGPSLVLHYRLRLALAPAGSLRASAPTVHVRRRFSPLTSDPGGFAEEVTVAPVPAGARLQLRLLGSRAAGKATRSPVGRAVHLGDRFDSRIILQEPGAARLSGDGAAVLLDPDVHGTARVVLHYRSGVPADRLPAAGPQAVSSSAEPVEIAPGFRGVRLPLPADIMPTGLTFRPDGRLVFCTLKGQVFEAAGADRDGNANALALLADGLPAPFGVHAGPGYVDVSVKYAVLRLSGTGSGGRVEAVASGWGYSRDYHDWAVGLPRNARGDYFVGIPCQQDRRSPAAARYHGQVLRLTPRAPTADDPRRYALEPLSAGHRFPMGLALDHAGELFATDNQGNYKPFNELNHVRPGVHFGFINELDRGKPAPPRTPPAIDIPHPWTRSVNGISFLDTPPGLRARLGRDAFGPLEGHLIGCEYDTRRLIRMTLERVGDTFQGAAYPLSIPPAELRHGFRGPLVCAVSPRGELYVGSIRDSGWGAGNNVGEIVRVRINPDGLPCGIAEVRAARDGFVLSFFRPIDRERAARADSYAVTSYRRESTPAYGGPDLDRRTERVAGVEVAPDGRRVTLRLGSLRPGFVYEFRLKNLAPGHAVFHPAEAYYTLRVVPR